MPVFSLEEVKVLQVKNISQENLKYFSEQPIYGYIIGGYAPPASTQTSSLIKVNFSDETTSTSQFSLGTRTNISASFNNQYAYYNRGFPQANGCYLNRLDFSSDVASEYSSTSFLGPSRFNLSAVSGNNYGWFAGGAVQPIPWIVFNTIARVDFSTAVMSLPGVNLPSATAPAGAPFVVGRSRASVVSNATYGYFAGGSIANPVRTFTNLITRMDLSVETFNNPGKNVPTGRDSMIGISAPLYGYYGGGANNSGLATINSLLRMDFSSETINIMTSLPAVRGFASTNGISNFSYGYFAGGLSVDSSNNHLSTTNRIDFSNETVSSSFNLPIARSQFAAAQGGQSTTFGVGRGSKSYGYFGGGYTQPLTYINTVTRLDFSTENVSNPPSNNNLLVLSGSLSAVSSNFYGYFGGGYNNTAPVSSLCNIIRLDFSNETTNAPGKNLPFGSWGLATVSNSSYGYFGGGFDQVPSLNNCTITRLDFSNETMSDPAKNLPSSRKALSGTSSSLYGYFGGGETPTAINTIVRLDFSNETISLPTNNLPSVRAYSGTVSNNFYGYFAGGFPYRSTITRLDFSNETATDSPTRNLPVATADLYNAGTSSQFYGFFGGGATGPVYTTINTVTRLDFSTENVSLPTKNLPSARSQIAALSNSN